MTMTPYFQDDAVTIFLNESVLATVRVDPDDENDLIVDVEDWKEQKP